MISRRSVVMAMLIAPMVPGASQASDGSQDLPLQVEVPLSDGLSRQAMRHRDRRWTMTGDRLGLDEGLPARLSLINDTGKPQRVEVSGPVFTGAVLSTADLAPGARLQLVFDGDVLGCGAIHLEGRTKLDVEVRPSYFPHPMV